MGGRTYKSSVSLKLGGIRIRSETCFQDHTKIAGTSERDRERFEVSLYPRSADVGQGPEFKGASVSVTIR